MGYVNTVAHHTASAARRAGDPVFLDPTFVRHANTEVGDLGWIEAVTTAVQVAAELAKTGLELKDSHDAAKAAKSQADAAQRAAASQAAKLLAEQKRVNDAQIASVTSKTAIVSKATPILIWSLGGAAALGSIYVLYRIMRKKR